MHGQFLFQWKGHQDESWMHEENRNCGAVLQDLNAIVLIGIVL